MNKISIFKFLRTNILTILTLVGVIFGIVFGLLLRLREDRWTQREVMYVNFVGDIFLRMLKGLIIPLIVSSLITAVGSLDLTLSGKIGGKAVIYYMITTVMAVILGIVLVEVIKPGVQAGVVNEGPKYENRNITTVDTLMDLIRNLFPPNVIQASTHSYQTILKLPNGSNETDLLKWYITDEFTEGMNILGLVVVSIVFGIAISSFRGKCAVVLEFFTQLSELMMQITKWVIWLSPIGISFLIASKIIEMEDLGILAGSLGLYFLTVLTGIIVHGFIIIPLIFLGFTRQHPYRYLKGMARAMATAFGTSSSSATLPVTIQCLEENNHIDPRVSRFVLPIGATINMDGTALYEAVAAIFIAQLRSVPLNFGNLVAISITATAASIGAAGIPQAGLVTLVMVLDTVGLPAEDVSLIIAVDWLLDRFRTLINVLGDAYGAGIVQHLSKDELNKVNVNTTPLTITQITTTTGDDDNDNNNVQKSISVTSF